MKTLYLTRNSNIVVNDDNQEICSLKDTWPRINSVYLITEPMKVVFGGSEVKEAKTFEVEPNQVIITFYSDGDVTPNQVVVIDNKEFVDNIKAIVDDNSKHLSDCDCAKCDPKSES